MNLIQLLAALGIGGILGGFTGAYFQSKFQHQAKIKEWEHELKKKRYLCINILLLAKIDTSKDLKLLSNNRPDITSEAELDKEIQAEFLNSMMFANNEVVNKFAKFISDPDHVNYTSIVEAMRKDLWGDKNTLQLTWDSVVFIVKDR